MVDGLPIGQAPGAPEYFVLTQGEKIIGVISARWAADHRDDLRAAASVAPMARRDFVVVGRDTTIFDLIAAMQRARAELAVVLSTERERKGGAPRIRGIVTKAHLAEALAEGMEIFED